MPLPCVAGKSHGNAFAERRSFAVRCGSFAVRVSLPCARRLCHEDRCRVLYLPARQRGLAKLKKMTLLAVLRMSSMA
jgi:hypothetical protein